MGQKGKLLTLPRKTPRRKSGLNRNKEGSIRNIAGTVYVDFIYLNERVRESAGLPWNEANAKIVREQLDRIVAAIKEKTFRFAEVFPESKRRDFFAAKEAQIYVVKITPGDVLFGEYSSKWLALLEASGRIAGRTLLSYKSYLEHYLLPFFGSKSFAELGSQAFEEFAAFAHGLELRGQAVSNSSINKYFVPLGMICRAAQLEYQWKEWNPFFGWKRLPQADSPDKILPFTFEEQLLLLQELPDHWQPYFDFAFRSGLRPGEQIGLKPEDIDWAKGLLHVRRAVTLDRDGHRCLGPAKNKYSRRTIRLTPGMIKSLEMQRKICERLGSEYFFCSREGKPVQLSNLRRRVWIPALERAGLVVREMKQTRHSFATLVLSCGESPLWIAATMGHRNADMVIRIYSRYVENVQGKTDGLAADKVRTDGSPA